MYEIGGLIIIGILAQWLAWRLRVPAILPLIIAGILIGPLYEYYTGHRLISPRFDADAGEGLFPGNLLYSFVSLSIGLILFEGGLTLNLREIRGLQNSILRLTTYGAFTTTIIAGLAAHYVIGLDWRLAFLFSTLIVVTGPTVIAPIMRQINVKRQISTILKWESIVIDPVGAFLAVLFYNFIIAVFDQNATIYEAILEFARSGLVGIGLGYVFGMALYFIIARLYVPKYLLNVFLLAAVIGAFLLSDTIAHESGLLTTVVMGATLANRETPFLHEILDFKESLTILLISMLFILLSANMSVQQIMLVLEPSSLLLFAIVVFLARPLGVFWSLRNSGLEWRDKAFISWVGPRGIVAAGVASLFGIELIERGVPNAEYITPLVFMIVLGTVLLNATLAAPMSKWLRVGLPPGSGVLIFGAAEGVRAMAKCLQDSGREVLLVSTNRAEVDAAEENNLTAHYVQDITDDLPDEIDLSDTGYYLAMTSSDEDNAFLINTYRQSNGVRGAYRLISRREVTSHRYGSEALFGPYASYLLLNRLARNHEGVHDYTVSSSIALEKFVTSLRKQRCIPLFSVCPTTGNVTFITAEAKDLGCSEEDKLYYLGPEVAVEEVADTLTPAAVPADSPGSP